MCEYVGEYVVSLTPKTFTDLRFHRHEEIVRCRDCRFSLAHGNGCGRNQDIYDAEPNGFCAWGARADA